LPRPARSAEVNLDVQPRGASTALYSLKVTDRKAMDEKIKLRITETGNVIEVVVLGKRAERITVVLGEGVHSVKCDLTPTRNGLAYAGAALGREVVYERSREQVQADIDRLNPYVRGPRRR
jgi:hypothetical protein